MDIFDQIMDDVEEKADINVSDTGIKTLTYLAKKYMDQEKTVSDLEDQLKNAKRAMARSSQVDIPEKMQELGIREFTLEDGSRIEVIQDVIASITKTNQFNAFKWLRENNSGSLIKNELKVQFSMNQDKLSDNFMAIANCIRTDPEFRSFVSRTMIKNLESESDRKYARKICDMLQIFEVKGDEFTRKQTVNSATLKAWVKNRLSEGLETPAELFGIYEYKKTKLTKKKGAIDG